MACRAIGVPISTDSRGLNGARQMMSSRAAATADVSSGAVAGVATAADVGAVAGLLVLAPRQHQQRVIASRRAPRLAQPLLSDQPALR